MLNIFIFMTFTLLVILIAIKYGLLEVLAIVLAIISLIPLFMSTLLYLTKSPVINYVIANKTKIRENNKFIYEFWLGIQCKKGQSLLKKLYIAPEWGITPTKSPHSTYDFKYTPLLEETGFTATASIDINEKPFFENNSFVYVIRFESDAEKNEINSKFILDLELDPMKHGFNSIFQPNYTYRYVADILVDYKNLNRQEGQLNKRY